MNTPSPLVPQGTQPQRGKSSLYFKVMMILTVHVVLIGGMLLQGCKDTAKEQTKDPALSQSGSDATSPSNSVATTDATIPPVSTTAMSNQVASTMPTTQPIATQPAPAPVSAPMVSATVAPATVAAPTAAPVGDGKEYLIAKGDTMGVIARRNSITVKALMDANPGVSPKKLRIGQKLEIPVSTGAMASASSGPAAAPAQGVSDGSTYTVKTGDTLGKIARLHGTSYKKIMALNDLKTTAIRVGQKLKMPTPKPVGAEAAPVSASVSATPGPVSAVTTPASGVAN